MLREWFTNDKGPRFKGDAPTGTSLRSSRLNWLGDSAEDYEENYELKTRKSDGSWNHLIHTIDTLNYTADNVFEESVRKCIHVDRALWYMALNNLVVNTDAYVGAGHNYYLYFDPATDYRMNILPWDLNESFGVHGPRINPEQLSPFAHENASNHPLSERLLAVPKWRALYLAHYRTLVRTWFDWDRVLEPLHRSYQERIREDVEQDDNYLFSREQFLDRPEHAYDWMGHRIPPLEHLIVKRQKYLREHEKMWQSGPTIKEVQGNVLDTEAPSSTRISIAAHVTSDVGVRSVVLRLKQEHLFHEVPMEHKDSGTYETSFAAPTNSKTVDYYLLATDVDGNVEVAPPEAEQHLFELLLSED